MPSISYPLKNGGETLIDEADLPLLEGRVWRRVKCSNKEYASCDVWGGKNKRVYLHRLLLGVHEQSLPWIDHKNGDGLDNTRSNLRFASAGLNSHNKKTTGVYRGVFAQSGGYIARVGKVYGGLFSNPVLAALAADNAARGLYGDDASLNFPSDLGSALLNARFLCTE
jgi:hypothetical protein